MDWTGCELVEVVKGKVSGAPLIVGTRVPAEVLVSNYLAGSPVKEIAENYPGVPIETIRLVLEFAESRRLPRAS